MESAAKITLTVMPDYGMGPFLWIKRDGEGGGVGGNCCDATGPCNSHPLSSALHQDFAAWVTEFGNATRWDLDSSPSVRLDWAAFHKRGLALARRLKAEVGSGFRVIYEKPTEDPYRQRCERREVNTDGTLTPLPTRRLQRQAEV